MVWFQRVSDYGNGHGTAEGAEDAANCFKKHLRRMERTDFAGSAGSAPSRDGLAYRNEQGPPLVALLGMTTKSIRQIRRIRSRPSSEEVAEAVLGVLGGDYLLPFPLPVSTRLTIGRHGRLYEALGDSPNAKLILTDRVATRPIRSLLICHARLEQ